MLTACSPTTVSEHELIKIHAINYVQHELSSNRLLFQANLITEHSLKNLAEKYQGLNSRLICSTEHDYEISGVAGSFDGEVQSGQLFSNPIYLSICRKDDINTCIEHFDDFKKLPQMSTCHLVLVTGVFGSQPRITDDFQINQSLFLDAQSLK